MIKAVKIFLLTALFCGGAALFAADSKAEQAYSEGRKLYLDGEYYDAAAKFQESFFMADTPVVRANSLLAQIGAYRMCELYYREFLAIEKLLERYPEYADCNALIRREFEIAEMFRTGTREPAFWALRWIPWLKDADRTEEVFQAVLKRAPFAPEAARAHMNLALYYEFDGRTAQSLAELRKILKNHPKSPESKYARLALANGLFELSKRGDGDSRLVNEAIAEFREFCRLYPEASPEELAFAQQVAGSCDWTALRDFYAGLELLTPRWAAMLHSPAPAFSDDLIRMTRCGIERYWLQAISDLDLISRVKMIIAGTLLVGHLGGEPIRTAQLYSKEIDNSIDNLEAILDATYTHPALTDCHLLGLLQSIRA
jgi:outer membrane protein assembly factor BamD (BamD/ComL family)